ncbi:MAG: hypothetical protein ACE5GN_02525 [Waddliaceae bacterium]
MQPVSNSSSVGTKYTCLQYIRSEKRHSKHVQKALNAIGRLVQDLEAQQDDKRGLKGKLIERAYDGLYSDYFSLEINPDLTLIIDLSEAGYSELANNAERGIYNDR